jgi:hypothetical protein
MEKYWKMKEKVYVKRGEIVIKNMAKEKRIEMTDVKVLEEEQKAEEAAELSDL